MNKIVCSLVTAAIASVAGGIALSGLSSEYLSAANAESSPENSVDKTVRSSLTGSATSIPSVRGNISEDVPTAKTYAHEVSGREAITVYVRDIPVATFLGNDLSKQEKGNQSELTDETSDSPVNVEQQARQFVDAISQPESNLKAENIRVKWDKDDEQYVIHLDDLPLIAMNGNVSLPRTTNDDGEDALQITNRLRRQLGNAKPLKTIEGRPQPPAQVAAAPTNVRRYQEGWASWYGPGFHGNLTASGTRYNQYELTAAHRTLPFGTRLRVTNRDNGRSVIVTITDRGPFIHNRVIDLSKGAAQAIGVTGISPVSLDLIN